MPEQERPPNDPPDPPVIEPPAASNPAHPVAEGEENGVKEPDVGAQHTAPLPGEIHDRLAAAERRVSALETERDGLREQLGSAQEDLRLAAAKYREAVLSASPELPPDLVAGDSVEEVDRSLVAARKTVDAVRRQLAGQAAAERVPAGAPARSGPDLSALSPREKIALALSRP